MVSGTSKRLATINVHLGRTHLKEPIIHWFFFCCLEIKKLVQILRNKSKLEIIYLLMKAFYIDWW